MWFNYFKGIYNANPIDLSYTYSLIVASQLIESRRPKIVMSSSEGNGSMILYLYKNNSCIPKIIGKSYAWNTPKIDRLIDENEK
jgi:hypothetical protein